MKITMRAKASLWVAFSLALLLGCSTPDKAAPPAVRAVLEAPGKSVVAIGEANDGASVILTTRQELRVELPLAAVVLDNGMDWRIAQSDPAVLDSFGPVFQRQQRDTNPTEASGTSVWRFKPKTPGHVNLAFELRQSHSRGDPVQTVHFDVNVK